MAFAINVNILTFPIAFSNLLKRRSLRGEGVNVVLQSYMAVISLKNKFISFISYLSLIMDNLIHSGILPTSPWPDWVLPSLSKLAVPFALKPNHEISFVQFEYLWDHIVGLKVHALENGMFH